MPSGGSHVGVHVALGGGLGAMARFGIGGWLAAASPALPWPTLLVNVSGSLALGFVVRALPSAVAAPRARAFLAIGFCGGFTTFSAFGLELLVMLRDARHVAAALYAAGSVTTCVAAVWAGLRLAALAVARKS